MATSTIVNDFPDAGHRHADCIRSALRHAEQVCRANGQRLTPLRRQVLELVWNSHHPVKAYELLEQLRAQRSGVAPPTVYRTLEFLRERGLVHRLESLNAFVGCAAPEERHDSQFLICRVCGHVAELADPGVTKSLRDGARRLGFSIDRGIIEIEGICQTCARS
jgi:Fur family zinc uptake transcriptional regulator